MGATTKTGERRRRAEDPGSERVAPPAPLEDDRLGPRVGPRLRPGGRCAAAKSPRRSIIPLRRNAEVDPGASLSAQHRTVVEVAVEGRGIPGGGDACANRPARPIPAAAHTAARYRSVAKRRRADDECTHLGGDCRRRRRKKRRRNKRKKVRPGPSRLRRRARRLHHCTCRRAQPKKKG